MMVTLIAILCAMVLTAACTQQSGSAQNAAPAQSTPVLTPATPAVPATTEIQTTVPANTATVAVGTSPGQAVPSPQPATSYLTYTNPAYSFSINYPSDWQMNDAPVANPSDPASPPGFESKIDVVEFYSPGITRCTESGCVNVRSEMHVEVDPTPSTKKLDQYYNKDVAWIATNYPIEVTAPYARVELSGQLGDRLGYDLTTDTADIKVLRAYTIINNTAFVLIFHAHKPYTGEVDQYQEYFNTAEDMFNSFQVQGGSIPNL
jgi:hypothetical protein